MPFFRDGKVAHFIRGFFLPEKHGIVFDQQTFPMKPLSVRKRLNYVLQGIRKHVNPLNAFGMPPVLQIEPVNYCNLRCRTCAFGAGLVRRPPVAMSFDLYRTIIDQVKDRVILVALWAWGEPFLHDRACDMIRYAKDSGLFVHTSTNGHFFETAEKAHRVILSGLDSIILCIDGLDQETYENYRVGGTLETVLRSTVNLVEEKKRLGRRNPRITLRFLVMKHNEHQVRALESLALKLGVDTLSLRSPIARRDEIDLEEELVHVPTGQGVDLFKEKKTLLGKIGVSRRHCSRPYGNLTVFSNGDVVLCENDHSASLPLGNASRDSLRRILSSDQARDRLALFRGNPGEIPFCRHCDERGYKGDRLNIQSRPVGKRSPR